MRAGIDSGVKMEIVAATVSSEIQRFGMPVLLAGVIKESKAKLLDDERKIADADSDAINSDHYNCAISTATGKRAKNHISEWLAISRSWQGGVASGECARLCSHRSAQQQTN